MRNKLWNALLASLSGIALLVSPAHAQRTRGLTPVPANEGSAVALSVTLDQKEPRIGSTVSICFDASKTGYATLWNISTAGQVVRVFPNQYSQVGPAAQIEGGRKYCAGSSGDPFRFRVDGPAGTEDLYLLWTTRTDLQPKGTDYADANALVQDLQRLGGANSTEWGTSKVTYDIVPAGGAVPPVVPAPQVTGGVTPAAAPAPAGQTGDDDAQPTQRPTQTAEAPKFWVLSMGANVEPLTKSNQDAKIFTTEVMKLFSIPNDNIRFLNNGTNADFVAGMDWLTEVAQPQDFVFIYFSGHGYRFKSQYSDDGWDEALVPYDFATPNADAKNLIASQRFAFLINRLQTKNVIAVIDSCHSAGVTRGLRRDVLGARNKYWHPPETMTDQLMADAAQAAMPRTRAAGGRNRIKANGLLLAAAHREQYAIEASGGSLFTMALVQEMGAKEGGTLMDVFDRTEKLTEKVSDNKQAPEAIGDFRVGRQLSFEQQ